MKESHATTVAAVGREVSKLAIGVCVCRHFVVGLAFGVRGEACLARQKKQVKKQ